MCKIGNEEVIVPGGIEFNDRDYCFCLLSSLKDMEKNYVIAMGEASNEWLYGTYKKMFQELLELQRELYILMFQKGWYQIEALDSKKIHDKYLLLESLYKSLSD